MSLTFFTIAQNFSPMKIWQNFLHLRLIRFEFVNVRKDVIKFDNLIM